MTINVIGFSLILLGEIPENHARSRSLVVDIVAKM